jgi:hypothetical protein
MAAQEIIYDMTGKLKPQDEIEALLVGKKVVSTDLYEGTLTLSDGTRLKVVPNFDGGPSGGDFFLQSLATIENAITAVELRDRYDVTAGENPDIYEIFVYAEGVPNEQRLVQVTGDAGNAYYGAGFKLLVTA